MRRFLIWLTVLVLGTVTVYGQSGCDIELEDSILSMIQAQRAADTGDTLTAVAILQGIQDSIDGITSGCDSVRFDETYTAIDNQISFRYPDGWQVNTVERGLFFVTSSSAVANAVEGDLPEDLAVGDGAIALQVQPTGPGTFNETVDDIIDDIQSDLSIISSQEDEIIRGRRTVSFNIRISDTVSGYVTFVDYTSEEDPSAVMLLLGLANTQSLPIIEVYTKTLRDSIQFPPGQSLREIGTPADSLAYSSIINIDEDYDLTTPIMITLSVDGTQLAYATGDELCIVSISDGDETCASMPPAFDSRPQYLYWSPDGRYIAFHQDVLRFFLEADIWIYEVEEDNFVNLTDDRTDSFGFTDIEVETWVDLAITWGPDNKIYGLRAVLDAQTDGFPDAQHLIIQVDPETGETVVLQDISAFLVFGDVVEATIPTLDGALSVSPDASFMALSARAFDRDSTASGIWVIDLIGGQDPVQVATPRDYQRGFSSELFENDSSLFAMGLAWDADGTGLYLYTVDPIRGGGYSMVHHLDLLTNNISTLMDLTGFTEDELFDRDDTTFPSPYYSPISATIAPDYSGVVVIHGNRDEIAVSLYTFEDGFSEPTTLFTHDENIFGPGLAQIGFNGNLLIGEFIILNDE